MMIMAIKIEIPANDISLFDLGAFDFEKRSGKVFISFICFTIGFNSDATKVNSKIYPAIFSMWSLG